MVTSLDEFNSKGTLGFLKLVSEQLKCVLIDGRRRQGTGREDGITKRQRRMELSVLGMGGEGGRTSEDRHVWR